MSAGHHARERETRDRRPLVIGLVVLAVLVTALVAWRVRGGGEAAAGCGSPTSATLVVTPELAPAIEAASRAMADEGRCSQVEVDAVSADQVFADLLAGTSGATLWVPDSDAWLGQLAAEGIDHQVLVPALASSPVVLAGGPSATAPESWASAFGSSRVVMRDPQEHAASALALVAPRAESETSGVSTEEISARLVPVAQDYGARAASQGTIAESLAAITATTKKLLPVTEQAYLAARRTNRQLVAVVPETGTFVQRHPLVALGGAVANPAVADLVDILSRPQGRTVLSEHGFRAADAAKLGRGGIGDVVELASPDPAEIQADLRMWDVLTVPSSLLAVVDASGSMDFPAGDSTRMELAMSAAGTALQAFPDTSRVGLWIFSIDRGERTDHRELVPLRRLDEPVGDQAQRAVLRSWLGRATTMADGGTGLYDTTLAAYRSAQEDYDPAYFNAVVLMSDGANEDPGSIRLEDLLKALRAQADPDRPVRIIAIGISEDADMAALEKIAEATNGSAYEARDPRDILEVMSKALLAR